MNFLRGQAQKKKKTLRAVRRLSMLGRGRAKVSFEAKLHGGKEVVRVLEIIGGLGEEELTGEEDSPLPPLQGRCLPPPASRGTCGKRLTALRGAAARGGKLLKNLTFGTFFFFLLFAVEMLSA